jgi:hypothetical protein
LPFAPLLPAFHYQSAHQVRKLPSLVSVEQRVDRLQVLHVFGSIACVLAAAARTPFVERLHAKLRIDVGGCISVCFYWAI